MPKRSPPKVSSINFYKHKFKKALQHYRAAGGGPIKAYASLKKQMTLANNQLIKVALLFVISTAAYAESITSGSLEIDTAVVSFSIPAIYLLFTSSFLSAILCFGLITVFQLVAFSTAFKSYFGRFRVDYDLLVFVEDVGVDDFIAPPQFDRFLQPSKIAYSFRSLVFSVIIFAALLPVFAALIFTVFHAYSTIIDANAVFLHRTLAIASVLLLLTSTTFLITAFVPFRTTRQTSLIRWLFLSKLHSKTSSTLHPMLGNWLQEKSISERNGH